MYEALNAMRRNSAEKNQQILARFEQITMTPMEVQKKLLLDLLQEHKDTEYGRKYGFADIHSIEEYRQRVPLTEYSDYVSYIDRMTENCEENLISAQKPVWYNKTSGTAGAPKKIPYSQKTRDCFSRYSLGYQSGFLYRNLKERYFGGRWLNLIRCGGDLVRLPDGVPYGPLSEASLRPYVDRWKHIFSTPVEATFSPKGTDVRYLNARFGLCDKELNNINCTFTGFLLDFCRDIEKNWRLF